MSDGQTDLKDNRKHLDRQTLEMDADAYASSQIWYYAEKFYYKRNELQGGFINSKKMMCEILLSAVNIFYIFMNNESSSENIEITKRNHFPSYYRFVLTIDSIRTTIKNTNTDFTTYDEISNLFNEFWKCLDIYNQIEPSIISKENFVKIINDNFILRQHEAVKMNWNKLREKLMQFSHVELPREYVNFD